MRFSRNICGTPAQSLLLLTIVHDSFAQDGKVNNTGRAVSTAAGANTNSSLPTVDLGYSLYRPTAVNITGQYYNFSNIRYGAPPLGDQRWRAPQNPRTDREAVNDGSLGYICPQAEPFWFSQANKALGKLITAIPAESSGQTQSEDCLFLDVIVPVKLFQAGQSKENRSKLAPVLVNIHGGGFFIGDKTTLYPPMGLLESADNKILYVSMNYRLGAFGFLSGLEQSDSNQTLPNAGLLDQRFALKWIQKYIHLFGGDSKQVTIIGESAGGGSVQYHTIAYGGARESNLFIRGIAQSPAPVASDPIYASLGANLFLRSAGINTVDAARQLPTETLQEANVAAQNATPYNVVYFGPVVDGNLLLDILPRSYSQGNYIKNVSMIVSNNQNEARFLGDQNIKTDADFDAWVHINFASAPVEIQSQIINEIYPARYNSSLPYRNPQERSDLAVKEYLVSCNTVGTAHAYRNRIYNYIFGIPPAIHAQDLAYTWHPNAPTPGFQAHEATGLQSYLTNFVMTGKPNEEHLPMWSGFGQRAEAINFTVIGIKQTTSDSANSRCDFWNKGTYFPKVE